MQEIWKDVVGYEGLYQVSNLGHIKSIGRKSNHKNTIIMKPFISGNRYFSVYLHKNNNSKRTFVHRIVALAFIPNPENKPYVNHINGNRFDNCVSNLEWCTSQENNSHAVRTGLNKGYSHWNGITGENNPHSIPVFQIDKNNNIVNTFCSAREASNITGISRRMISNCCNGTKKSAGGYFWKFVDEEKHQKFSSSPIKIKKYDINHNFICEYRSLSQIKLQEHISPFTLKRHIKDNTPCSGFYWEYS